MTNYQLEEGICAQLAAATPNDDHIFTSPHVLQLLSVKKIGSSATNNPNDRFRVILSDGQHFIQAMLATQLNNLYYEHAIEKHTVIKTERLSCNFVQEKRLLILMGLSVLGQADDKIGNPVAISTDEPSSKPPSAASTPAVQKPAQVTARGSAENVKPAAKSIKNNWHPIEALSPYQNNWTIKARCTQKSDMKTWSNSKGEGKLFNVTLMDETGEIRGTAFNAVADTLFSKFEEGKVYFVSKAKVNLARKKFSNVSNDYELNFERNTEVEECHETTDLPMVKYNFVSLGDLESMAKDATCDVVAILTEVGELSTLTSKATQKELKKRDLTIVDKSGYSTRMTLWGNQAENFKTDEPNPVIAFKGVKVGDFQGRNLSMLTSSLMTQNPDIEEVFALRGWYDAAGRGQTFQSHTNTSGSFSSASGGGGFRRDEIRSLIDVKRDSDALIKSSSEAPQSFFFSTRAAVMHIKADNIAYPACKTPDCNKKVTENGGLWTCEKCNKSHDAPSWRYIISMAVSDPTAQVWLQGFNDVGEVIFGRNANDLVEIKESNESQYNQIMHQSICTTYNFSVRAKPDQYGDSNIRMRYGVVRVNKLDYKEEANFLLEKLLSPWGQQDL
ncbi:replication factor-A protein 1 [Dendrothele bispora CBS 962.96]|uniref:Replication protein A subunit n=1 Tax=Dendrothele bispora (strain CBS 962.96) TaxID=1314807 RepID=A0A4S8MX70_DENBC|nr:replication factor-A protein 1 [Dendrothele bispora CBS 962.96]